MADPRVISEWVEKADEDFEFAVSVIEESAFYPQICFHFHQAAEKYLKSYIIAQGLEFKKIHDLPVLLNLCSAKDPSLQVLVDDCRILNRFYIDTRYPVHWPSNYTKGEALKAKMAEAYPRWSKNRPSIDCSFFRPLMLGRDSLGGKSNTTLLCSPCEMLTPTRNQRYRTGVKCFFPFNLGEAYFTGVYPFKRSVPSQTQLKPQHSRLLPQATSAAFYLTGVCPASVEC